MLKENEIYLGDCLELMKQIPDKSIDCVITDPPYELTNGGSGISCLKSIGKISNGLADIENGFDIGLAFSEFKRVLKTFNCFVFCSNKQVSKIMSWGEQNGYYTTCLVWHKYNATPFCNGVWKSDIEFIIHIREKGATFKGNAEVKSKVSTLPIETSKYGHPTEKPVKLISKYIQIGTNENDLILDPFLGSGTTAIACYDLKRRYIGIEKCESYYNIAKNRIEQFEAQGRLF
jgi:site-specific DNA-methyltransferase (adenine-specific)